MADGRRRASILAAFASVAVFVATASVAEASPPTGPIPPTPAQGAALDQDGLPRDISAVGRSRADYSHEQVMFGPLACALEIAYARWLAGPLDRAVPSDDAFATTLDATNDPYVVSFFDISNGRLPSVIYRVPASSCLESSLPPVPASEIAYKGPITLSGTYAKAIVAALPFEANRIRSSPPRQDGIVDPFANTNAPGGEIIVERRVFPKIGRSRIFVGFVEHAVPKTTRPGYRVIGCYKEQAVFVDPVTWNVTVTRGCPG